MVAPTLKVGQKVVATSSTGVESRGKVAGTITSNSGAWVDVNVAEPRKPAQLKRYRPRQVVRA